MSRLLKKTDLSGFTHHLYEGRPIVRNPRISALISTKLTGVSSDNCKFLAKPVFTGTPDHEIIMWQTDRFASEPQPLSRLTGEEREKYESILKNTLQEYGAAVGATSESYRNMFKQAITYHSLDNVFCADDKVVITEWGMHPKDKPEVNMLPLGVPIGSPYQYGGVDKPQKEDDDEDVPEDKTSGEDVPEEKGDQENDDTAIEEQEEPVVEEENNSEEDVEDDAVDDAEDNEADDGLKEEETEAPQTRNAASSTTTPIKKSRGRNIIWKWLLWLLLLLLLLLIILYCIGRCSNDPLKDVPRVSPEIDPDDIELSEDSVTKIVGNRVILLIRDGGSVSDFVKAFRKVYPDKEKYQFANPDTIIPRIVLILPKEEKTEFIESLPEKFPDWELSVLPETIFESSSTSVNDPAMKDDRKRWYFDMCSVFDAWDVEMGREDVVVAVIDDGFDLSHPELAGKVVDKYNAVTHDTNVFASASGHGTHVAATAVGVANNGQGTAGIAPSCKLMPIQVGDRNGVMAMSSIVDGVLYAIQNDADVVNMSLGMSFSPFLQFLPEYVQRSLIANNFLEEEAMWNMIFEMAEERNVTFVIAGGNQNILIGIDPMQRSGKVIKVSAVQPDKSKASFSNYGEYSTLSAPGVMIYNAVPGNKYTYMEGTSMASPIVAGGVALLKSHDKSLTTSQVANILKETGIPSPSDVGPIVNFAKALDAEPSVGSGSCDAYQERYNELLEELEQLKREHPDCISDPDTLVIPVDAKVTDITGTWKSTTPLVNNDNEDVVLYFTFNGTPNGVLTLVEPDGSKYTAPLSVDVRDDKIYIEQTADAVGSGKSYTRYSFVCRPDKDRRASCTGQNLTDKYNKVVFRLIRLNH